MNIQYLEYIKHVKGLVNMSIIQRLGYHVNQGKQMKHVN